MENKTICEFCNKELSIEKLGIHLKRNHKNKFNNEIEVAKYFLGKKENITFEVIDQIIEEYKDSSVLHIETKYGIRFRQYVANLGLEHKSISVSRKSKLCQEKQRLTNKNKYGFENVSQSSEIKEKKKKTFIKNYGVDNIWKLREYRVWYIWEYDLKTMSDNDILKWIKTLINENKIDK